MKSPWILKCHLSLDGYGIQHFDSLTQALAARAAASTNRLVRTAVVVGR